MPRFHFHLFNRIGDLTDEEGRELADLDAARAAAAEEIRSLLSEDAKLGLIDFKGRIEIADGSGQVLEIVRFQDVVQLRLDAP